MFTSVNKICSYPIKKKFFSPLGDLNLYPNFLVLLLPRFLFLLWGRPLGASHLF